MLFRLTARKFLGFLVSQRGIETNLEKIQVIIDMESPSTSKEVQHLTGRMAALNRFISNSAAKCLSFFKLLRGATRFQWTQKMQEAFKKLKT